MKQTTIEKLFEKMVQLTDTQIEIAKLRAVQGVSTILSMMISHFVLMILASFFFIMISIAGALMIGQLLQNNVYGFLIISSVYFSLMLIWIILQTGIRKKIKDVIIVHTLQ